MVPVELTRILISETDEQQVIYLREQGGERVFPIVIGIYEAIAIHRRIKEETAPRPLTHDLIVNVAKGLGAKFKRVFINDLKDNTFYAIIVLEMNGRDVEIDSRPSDAVAVAVNVNIPIFVAEHVLARASLPMVPAPDGEEEDEEEKEGWKEEDEDEDDED